MEMVEETTPTEDYYAELYNLETLFKAPIGRQPKSKHMNLVIASQNLRGFAKKSRRKWISGWRRKRGQEMLDIIMVQDTALKNENEKDEIQEQWERVWQVTNSDNPLSFWTTASSNAAGMGILFSPHLRDKITPWQKESWTSRVMAVELNGWLLVNIYAPTQAKDKRQFFQDLEPWLKYHGSIVLGGDFNCVLRPERDRVVARRPSFAACESPELRQLMNRREFTDAIDLNHDLDDDREELNPLHHYTFWRKDGASRLDRFYVKGEAFNATQWVDVVDPAHDSDHQELRIVIKTKTDLNRIRTRIYYPIQSGRPQRVQAKIEEHLTILLDQFDEEGDLVNNWDNLVRNIQAMLVEVRQADRKQTQRYYQKLRSETRIPRETRAEIIQDREREAKLRAARSFGNSLRRSTEEIRRFYKKNSEWQRDQPISSIQPSPGHFYAADLPTEERMASEWNHI
ncbi:hypothetical protein L917_20821, partial [Phytophthora nicotianae]